MTLRSTVLVVFVLSYVCISNIARADIESGFSPCVQTTRDVNDGFKTPWRITPRDVQNIALGKHRIPVKWRRDEMISYGVEGTSTTLLVEITRRKAAIKFVNRDGGQRGGSMVAYSCPSVLAIPVHVKASTQDGVVALEGDTELVVTSRTSIVMTLYAPQRGTLKIRALKEDGTVVDSFGMVLGFRAKRTVVGAIGGGYKCGDANCMHLPYAYACFPDKPPFRVDEFIYEACEE